MISWNVGIETRFTLSVGKIYKFLDNYVPKDLWNRLLSAYCMDSYENVWRVLFICHELFRKVSKEVAGVLVFVYPEYNKNITRYTKDLYNQYVSKIENGTKI